MKNIKKLMGIFESYTYGEILQGINEGKMYLQVGSENLPIDVSDSLRFLKDLEKLIGGIVYSPKKYELVKDGENLGEELLLDCRFGILLKGGNEEPKLLRAEMHRILTEDNLEQYIRVMGFVEMLIEIFKK